MRITVTIETQPQSPNAEDMIRNTLQDEEARRYLESAIEKAIDAMMGWCNLRACVWVFAR